MAKDEAALRLAKLARLLPVAKDLSEKLGAVLEEIDEISGGGAGIQANVKRAEQCFDTLWCDRYAAGQQGRYMWRRVQDVPNMKRLVKGLGLAELMERIARYIQSDDPYIVKARHPFGLFVSGINSYASAAAAPDDFALDAPAASDCRREGKHQPPCRSDQEHTERKMRELRG